jgi:glycopeptide antibiotics resistance protein
MGKEMLQACFLWFYCLPIADAVLLAIAMSGAYLILRSWLEQRRFWRPAVVVLLLAWLAVIAMATLTDRTASATSAAPELLPFHSYRAVIAGENKEILRSNFMNVVLFYPAGLLTCELLPKGRSLAKRVLPVAALFALVSAGIELCQYLFALGRVEADDVIHNALGALMGALVCMIRIKRKPAKSGD